MVCPVRTCWTYHNYTLSPQNRVLLKRRYGKCVSGVVMCLWINSLWPRQKDTHMKNILLKLIFMNEIDFYFILVLVRCVPYCLTDVKSDYP